MSNDKVGFQYATVIKGNQHKRVTKVVSKSYHRVKIRITSYTEIIIYVQSQRFIMLFPSRELLK